MNRARRCCLWLAPLGAVLAAGCGTPGRGVVVDVSPAPIRSRRIEVAEEIGRLLSADPELSRAAERRLVALDGEDRERFLAVAADLQGEQDVRLLHVLDEHGALPGIPPGARIEFFLWKAERPERFYGMKAQSRLLDLARSEPDAMLAGLAEAAPDSAAAARLAVALALAGERRAVPVLLARYREASSPRARAVAAEALALLAGEPLRPRVAGLPADVERDAAAIEAWYGEAAGAADVADANGGGG